MTSSILLPPQTSLPLLAVARMPIGCLLPPQLPIPI